MSSYTTGTSMIINIGTHIYSFKSLRSISKQGKDFFFERSHFVTQGEYGVQTLLCHIILFVNSVHHKYKYRISPYLQFRQLQVIYFQKPGRFFILVCSQNGILILKNNKTMDKRNPNKLCSYRGGAQRT